MLKIITTISVLFACAVAEAEPVLEFNAHSSFKTPRPYRNETNVPVYTTIYFVIKNPDAANDGKIDPDSIEAFLSEDNKGPLPMLKAGRKFQTGFDGQIFLNVRRLRMTWGLIKNVR